MKVALAAEALAYGASSALASVDVPESLAMLYDMDTSLSTTAAATDDAHEVAIAWPTLLPSAAPTRVLHSK